MLIKNKKTDLHLQKTRRGIQINYFSSKLQNSHNLCFHQVLAAVMENSLSSQQKEKKKAWMLLEGTSNFLQHSKLNVVAFLRSAKYVI